MKKGLIALGVILLVGFMMVGSFVGRYNGFVVANEQIDGAWAQVENVLQRRGDLIPNLVSTVQGFAEQEREIFIEVANARGRLAGAVSPAEAGAANAGLLAAQIIGTQDEQVLAAIDAFRKEQTETVLSNPNPAEDA